MNAVPHKTTLKQVRAALKEYAEEVDGSELAASSKAVYIDFATFVRWMHGEFQPGAVGSRRRQTKPFKSSE